LIAELEAADTIVIGVPLYNFGIPAALKAWIDLIARARRTFRYTEAGPEGLLKDKKAYLVVASGGVPVGSDYDFATGYLRHVLGFVGITDVTVIDAGQQMMDGDVVNRATAAIDDLKQAA
jgi:FMN-dependent NADH-azoreductase